MLTHKDPPKPFNNILRMPDLVRSFDIDDAEIPIEKKSEGLWQGKDFEIGVRPHADSLAVSLRSPGGRVAKVQLRWHGDLKNVKSYLGDAWERSYADLSWQCETPNRGMPWYFMAYDGRTHGYGVRTGPGALCFWNADCDGISLWADVRSGGNPVQLGDRELSVAEVVCREGKDGESPFAATQAFCRQMCPGPRLPGMPVYGTNDWNYAYGNSSVELIAGMAGVVSELSPNSENRPFSVIDEGWAMGPYENNFGHGPWVGNPKFGDMAAFAGRLHGMGVRPGLWYRPLTPLAGASDSWKLKREAELLDPTIPEVQQQIADHIARFVGWGYELIKHDYTTFDILGAWGTRMGSSPTRSGWAFNDSSKTSAEVITDLYHTIRKAAGNAYIIGCNTMTHLSAGIFEIQRTGDDTSGRSWDRCRRMGVNTLGFRAAQHRAFYEVDPDIVAITSAIPWPLGEQWLRLVSQSGAALFVAIEPGILDSTKRSAVQQALKLASTAQVTGDPLDWMETNCPRRWHLLGKEANFNWMGPEGSWPFGD